MMSSTEKPAGTETLEESGTAEAPEPEPEPEPAELTQEGEAEPVELTQAPAEAVPEPPPDHVPYPFIPDGQPGWFTDIVHQFHDRLRALGG